MTIHTLPEPVTRTTKEDVVARSMGDETVLLDLDSGTYFTLNAVGGVIWRQLEKGGGLEESAVAVVDEYEVSL